VICEYLDELYPNQTPLYPADAFRKAKLKISIDFVTTRIIPAFHRFIQWTEQKPYGLEEAQKEFQAALLTWIKDADREGPFFAGEKFSMADVQLGPWLTRKFYTWTLQS
jgi:glutathione S-transferase